MFNKPPFTLIELLVVIAVIAILGACILQALSNARATARTSECMNNVRQVGLGYLSYADTYNYTPPVWSNGNTRWMDLIAPYVNNSGKDGCADGVWRCQSDVSIEKITSYGINQTYSAAAVNDPKSDLLWYGISWNKIKDPSGFIVLADSSKYYIGKDRSGAGKVVNNVVEGGVYCYLVLRHQKGFVAVFADSHSEYINYENMPARYWDYNGYSRD